MAWHRPGNKPLSQPLVVSLLMHICIPQPQWVSTHLTSNVFIIFFYWMHFLEMFTSIWALNSTVRDHSVWCPLPTLLSYLAVHTHTDMARLHDFNSVRPGDCDSHSAFNSLRPRESGSLCIWFKVYWGINSDMSSLVQVMAWHLLGAKPLPEPLLTKMPYTLWDHWATMS